MMQATDWLQHSVRGFLAGTVKKKLGFPLTSLKPNDGVRRYRIERGALADMNNAAIDIAMTLARLSEVTTSTAWRVAAASSNAAADAALPRPLDPRDRLQASGAGVWRPLPGHDAEAGAGRCRSAEPRRGRTHAADLLEAGHAARAGVARGHPYRPHPCRWDRVARSRYRSLSVLARKITGARWSGPRFFGLRQRPLDSTSTARTGHGQG